MTREKPEDIAMMITCFSLWNNQKMITVSTLAWILICSFPHWMLAVAPEFTGLTEILAKRTSLW